MGDVRFCCLPPPSTCGGWPGSAYTVNLYPNPTAPLLPLHPKPPVGEGTRASSPLSAKADRWSEKPPQSPRQKHDWLLKRLQGGRAHPLATCGVATLSPRRWTPETSGNVSPAWAQQQPAAKGSSTTVSRSDIRFIQHSDSSALWSDGPEVALNWHFPLSHITRMGNHLWGAGRWC
jgi:hypothetical protein